MHQEQATVKLNRNLSLRPAVLLANLFNIDSLRKSLKMTSYEFFLYPSRLFERELSYSVCLFCFACSRCSCSRRYSSRLIGKIASHRSSKLYLALSVSDRHSNSHLERSYLLFCVLHNLSMRTGSTHFGSGLNPISLTFKCRCFINARNLGSASAGIGDVYQ